MLGIRGVKSKSSGPSELGQVSGTTRFLLDLPQEQQQTWIAQMRMSATRAHTPKTTKVKGDWLWNQSKMSLGSMVSMVRFWVCFNVACNFSAWLGSKNRIGILKNATGIWLDSLAIRRENLVAFWVSVIIRPEKPATCALMAFSANWQSPRFTNAMVCLLVMLYGIGEQSFESSFTTLPSSCKEKWLIRKFPSFYHSYAPGCFYDIIL